MKRTKETFFRYHPDWKARQTISGLRQFDGQDLEYQSRKQFYTKKQRQWLDQQTQQNKEKANREKFQEMCYAKQTIQLNRMRSFIIIRGMLQDNFLNTKHQMRVNTKQQNLQFAKQRRDQQKSDLREKLNFERQQRDILLERGVKRAFQMDV